MPAMPPRKQKLGLAFSASGNSIVANAGHDPVTKKPRRRSFSMDHVESYDKAVQWLAVRGIDEEGGSLRTMRDPDPDGEVVPSSAADGLVGQHCASEAAFEAHARPSSGHACGEDEGFQASAIQSSLYIRPDGDDVASGLDDAGRHSPDPVGVDTSTRPSAEDAASEIASEDSDISIKGLDSVGDCVDDIAHQIASRSQCISALGEYWGFADWIAWAYAEKVQVKIFFAAELVDLFQTFCSKPIGHFDAPTLFFLNHTP